MPKARKQMSNEELAEFTRKAMDETIEEVVAQVGRELIENRKREKALKDAKQKTEHETVTSV